MRNASPIILIPLISGLALVGCGDPQLKFLGGEISGEVEIAAALRPLLPPPPGATGRSVAESEPNTVPPNEFNDVGTVETDVQPTIVTGSLDAVDIRDRFLLRASGSGQVSIALNFTYTEGTGTTNVFLATGTALNADNSNVLGTGAAGTEPVNLSAVVTAGQTLLVQIRHLADTPVKYNLTVSALGGTVVGDVYVVAFVDDDTDVHPARIDDPVRIPKLPIGASVVTAPDALETDGTWRGTFEALALYDVVAQAPLPGGTKLRLFAYADNDGTSASSPANFAIAPTTPADFIASNLIRVLGSADGEVLADQALVIDSKNFDQDFDGLLDDDRNGDGVADDNCPTKSNPGQEDGDSDGVGDLCDDCPGVADPEQINSDGEGRGDACNQDANSLCPAFGMYPQASCPIDSDADGIDDSTMACADGVPACLPVAEDAYPATTPTG